MPKRSDRTELPPRGERVEVSEEWFDGSVWEFSEEDFAGMKPESFKARLYAGAVKRGLKGGTARGKDGVLLFQAKPIEPVVLKPVQENESDEREVAN